MSFFKTLLGAVFSDHSVNHTHTDINSENDLPIIDQSGMDINPANGLPMIDDSIDVAGNPYGTDHSSITEITNHLDSASGFDSSSSLDDSSSWDSSNDFDGSSGMDW